MYLVCESRKLNGRSGTKELWDSTYWRISWPTTAYFGICDHWKSQQVRNFRGRSVCIDLVQIRKKVAWELNERCQKFSMQCSRDVENRGKARMHWNKRLWLDPGNKKEQKSLLDKTVEKIAYLGGIFSKLRSRPVIFVLVQIQKVIFCKNRWLFFCLMDIPIWRTF